MELKDRIKEKRIEKGFTLEDLAKKVGTSKQTIHRYESGIISNIPSDKIESIASALNTTPAYLMGWSDDSGNDYNPLKDANWKKFEEMYSLPEGNIELLHIYNALDASGQEQLLRYGQFLLSQKEK